MERGVRPGGVTEMTTPVGVVVELLGGLRVSLDGRSVTAADWPRRAQELVALLALADHRRLARDRVLEHLWPHLDGRAGAANLRKAAHHARRALGAQEAVVLKGGTVVLFPGRPITTDVEAFLRRATDALRSGDPARCAEAAATCAGELLPDALYEGWTQDARRQVHARLVDLLRRSGDLERLIEIEPTDEAASRELMRANIEAGRRHAAIRCMSGCGSPSSASWGPGPTLRLGRSTSAAPPACGWVSPCSWAASESWPLPWASLGASWVVGPPPCWSAGRSG